MQSACKKQPSENDFYSDTIKIYSFCRHGDNEQLQSRASACVNDFSSWMFMDALEQAAA